MALKQFVISFLSRLRFKAREIKLFSLEFFAARFGFKAEELCYGVADIQISDMEKRRIPVIIIKNTHIFIHILEDNLYSLRMPNATIAAQECVLSETGDEYIFVPADGMSLTFSHEKIESFYALKYYCKKTKKCFGC